MWDNILKGIFDSTAVEISIFDFVLCIAVSLAIGLILAYTHTYKNRYSKGFIVTLALIPAIVCVVIMMVNGNIGAGVAVAGTFSLVKFRSVPGTAKEICAVFAAMSTGLMAGMGYLGFAVIFAVILSMITIIYSSTGFGNMKTLSCDKTLRVTIPEDLDYTGVFDDLLNKYTSRCEVQNVKTTNMGSLFKITYRLTLKDEKYEKCFIDDLRCRNGNLEISMSKQETAEYEL